MHRMPDSLLKRQFLPLVLTIVVCAALVGFLWLEIVGLNQLTSTDILLQIHWVDVLVGLTIYLKTSIDFAIFIGLLMSKNASWKSRIAIEVGTALGNALGTMAILLVWTFFKEIRWLLAIMVFLAALVLFKLAEDSLEHVTNEGVGLPIVKRAAHFLERGLQRLNHFLAPVLRFILPNLKATKEGALPFWPLFLTSFTIPFILGLDDFAGYVPLFSVVNVLGFGTGVFVGHMILNFFLFLSPERTIRIVKNSLISFLGSIAFIGLGVWGLVEVVRILAE
jgi:cadmium resistance protein CadD (predicted permease)